MNAISDILESNLILLLIQEKSNHFSSLIGFIVAIWQDYSEPAENRDEDS